MQRPLFPSQLLRNALLASALAVAGGCSDDADDDREQPFDDAGQQRDGGGRDADVADDATADADTDAAVADGAIDPGAADLHAVTSTKRLLTIQRATGEIVQSVAITGMGDETPVGADVRPADAALYVLGSGGSLFTLDAASGAATLKVKLTADANDASEPFVALAGDHFGVDFNPVADRLRVVSSSGQNLRINVDSGATTTDGVLTPATPGVSAAAYTNSFAAACRTKLFLIDGSTGKLLLQDPPNDGKLTEIGALGEAGQVHAFEIQSAADGAQSALVALRRESGEQLAQIDLNTGKASLLSALALQDAESVVALLAASPTSSPAQSRGELLAVTAGDKLISFNRGAPGKACTTASIAGLAGEIVGADVRPADGALYVVSKPGTLYTVALDSGQATQVATLVADAADGSDPYAGLAGDSFGVGFNPVPDRLRIISNSGQNLRVNVATGATTTDVALSPAGSAVTAVAYTNSFAGAKSTTLFALDSTADTLVRVGAHPATGAACPDAGNPNCGVVATVGALNAGGDVSSINGFDIDPVAGSALAALSVGSSTSSALFSIDLTTGAATSLGASIAGGEKVLGLVFAANPVLTAYATTSDDKLVVFSPFTPATPTRSVALTGLQSGEKLLGIDVRPLDGALYAVGSSSRLYRVDTNSGALGEVATLTSGGAPLSLPAASYALDFNPAADALRLVASTGQNYRILPSTRMAGAAGVTFVDTALSPGTPSVSAAGYTQSFSGTSATTLYVIDGNNLALQGGLNGTPSPNGGILTVQGPLGQTPVGDVGFDIVGAHSGLALAALSTDGSAYTLQSVNLVSGAASAFNASANQVAGGALRGFALQLK